MERKKMSGINERIDKLTKALAEDGLTQETRETLSEEIRNLRLLNAIFEEGAENAESTSK